MIKAVTREANRIYRLWCQNKYVTPTLVCTMFYYHHATQTQDDSWLGCLN